MKRQRTAFVAVLSVIVLLSTGASSGPTTPTYNYHAYLPLVSGWLYGVSRYILSTSNTTTLYNEGCQQGLATPSGGDSFVILDFGYPGQSGTNYGTWLLPSGIYFQSTLNVASLAEYYLSGFHGCAPTGARLSLVVGSVNSGSGLTAGHGQAWANMINTIWTWINTPPSFADKVSIAGGIDIEPGFGPVTAARAWVDAYASAFQGNSYLYNYGSCDGCPSTQCPTCVPGANGYIWSVEDIYYVSYAASPSFPVPDIYATNGVNADQWYRISLYGYTNHNGASMYIRAALTEWQACRDNGGCGSLNNSPYAGWSQLFGALNADPLGRTNQTPGSSTDITWQN